MTLPHWTIFWASPIGVVPKKAANEFRMIQHLSLPFGQSINDHMFKEFSSVQYASVDDAIRLIKSLERGCAMAKCDVRGASRIIPLHPDVYHLFGIHWNGKYDLALPMGCASSC